MKKFLLLFLLYFFIIPAKPVFSSNISFLKNETIVVDPGHGGYDPGAVYKDIYEKHINLQIALKLKNHLEETGAKVILTRNADYNLAVVGLHRIEAKRYDLAKRVELANKNKASLFVSIHANKYHSAHRSGADVFYDPKSEKSKRLAECILEELRSLPGTPPKRMTKPSQYYVLRNNGTPAVLVEVGYLSNPDDRKNLLSSEYQTMLADRISCGIIKYLLMEPNGNDKTHKA